MTWVNSTFTLADASSRQQEAWDLLISNWGDMTGFAPADATQQFPAQLAPGLTTPAAIAIGPSSLVDRCWVAWDLQKLVANPALWDYLRRLSVGAPLTFSQPANIRQVLSAILLNAGSLAIYPNIGGLPENVPGLRDSTDYRNTYLKANGVAGVFGPGATITRAAGPATETFWMAPFLHLVFYLRAPVAALPVKRAPMHARQLVAAGSTAAGEQLIAQIPIFGRKTVGVQIQPGSGGVETVSIRLAVISSLYNDGGALTPQEHTVHTATPVIYGNEIRHVITDSCADYLMVYVNPLTSNNPNVIVDVVALD